MEKHSINKLKGEVKKLVIGPTVTEEEAMASMRILQNFNQCMIGISSFEGETPWENHRDDEFLQVLDGEVDLLIIGNDGRVTKNLQGGDCFVVPADLWHRQTSRNGAKILFITSLEGNQSSMDESPSLS